MALCCCPLRLGTNHLDSICRTGQYQIPDFQRRSGFRATTRRGKSERGASPTSALARWKLSSVSLMATLRDQSGPLQSHHRAIEHDLLTCACSTIYRSWRIPHSVAKIVA
jgi:hypothetical protein